MIRSSFKEAFSPEWLETNITNPIHELVIIREIIPWEKIISRLCRFYDKSKGPFEKSLRTMTAILIVMKYCRLSDREVVKETGIFNRIWKKYVNKQVSSQNDKIALFHSLFKGREDVFPKRFESAKTGKSGY